MRHAFLACVLTTPLALAQNCFDGDFGTRLGINTVDTVYPMQPIGFTFPFGGTTYTNIHVNDHGFVQLSNNGVPPPLTTNDPILYTPSTTNFAAGGPKVAPLYCDMELTGGGECFINSSATKCVVTWLNVQSFGIPNPRFSFQLTIEPSGIVRFTFGPNVTNNSTWGGISDNGVCGVTPAGGITLPGSLDLSAGGNSPDNSTFENWATANGFDMANNTLFLIPTNPGFTYTLLGAPANCASTSNFGTGCDNMSLTSVGLPSFGNTNFKLRVSGVEAISPIAFVGFGTTAVNPGVPLGFIGMTGCNAYTSLDIGLFTGGPVAAGVSDFTLPIPVNPSLVGASVTGQGLGLTLATPANLAASGGTTLTLGFGN
jgi:hypothetical protein